MIKSFPVEKSLLYRKRFSFINRSVRIVNDNGKESDMYPCIVLVDTETDVVVAYTGYERFLCVESSSGKVNHGSTLAGKAVSVCKFLNYVLHETDLNSINECGLNDIRNFLIESKTKDTGEEYAEDTWSRTKNTVLFFLREYYLSYYSKMQFNYNGEDLQKIVIIRDSEHHRKIKLVSDANLHVDAPKTKHKKNRYFVYGYLELLLYEAKKYDPMITLAIALQSYAGLREGSVMNLSVGRVKMILGGFGSIKSILLDLNTPAPFWSNHNYKTNPAEIKKQRSQQVYDDFVMKVNQMYTDHIAYMELKGYDTSPEAPLFLNKWGNPLTEFAYRNRVKDLFYNHFLPSLKQTCISQNTWAENAAYIEAYEKEYPGAHMFRHWFTMYLLTKAKLSPAEIQRWRGDSSDTAMLEYIHENDDMRKAYEESTYRFIESILKEINSYE